MRARFVAGLLVTVGLMGIMGVLAGCGGLADDTAATVNGTVIKKDDVTARISQLRKVYGAMVPEESEGDIYDNFRRETTDQLVREELENQQTKDKNITVSQAEIDQRMQDVADESFLGDVSRMKQDYAAKGLSEEDMAGDVRRAILHEKLMASLQEGIEVSDEDALAFYERNRLQYDQPERRQVRQIVTDKESAALEATSRARAGESFVTLVDELSTDADAQQKKGALGLVTKGQLAPELDAAIWNMSFGQVSEPIKVGEQWYVLSLENVIPASLQTFDQARDEIKIIYANQIFAERWREFVEDVYDTGDIEFSADYDPASKVDLGGETTETTPAN
ncbi:MAG: peptidyl-prolyl cis-trans isomerase [Thermoleophilia bacterium]|nr:peptidyl-prolyl cis-trans isomerase [Thermoleophilia bacterium]